MTAPDAAVRCAKDAIQTFGGIGYTFEHDVHLYYRRALTLRALLGPSAEWADQVAGLALAGVTREMEIDLPEEAEPLRERIRAEIAEIARLEGMEQKRALAEAGFVMPHLPRPWGRDATPLEQVLILQELRPPRYRPPQMIIGAWVVPSHRRVRHAGAAGAVPAAHAQRRDDLVPAVLRAGRGLRPRLAAA